MDQQITAVIVNRRENKMKVSQLFVPIFQTYNALSLAAQSNLFQGASGGLVLIEFKKMCNSLLPNQGECAKRTKKVSADEVVRRGQDALNLVPSLEFGLQMSAT